MTYDQKRLQTLVDRFNATLHQVSNGKAKLLDLEKIKKRGHIHLLEEIHPEEDHTGSLENDIYRKYTNALTRKKISKVCKQSPLVHVFRMFAQKGIFPRYDLPEGTLIGKYIGFDVTKDNVNDVNIGHATTGENGQWIFSAEGLARANHSDTPNMNYNPKDLTYTTNKHVSYKTELTWLYRLDVTEASFDSLAEEYIGKLPPYSGQQPAA